MGEQRVLDLLRHPPVIFVDREDERAAAVTAIRSARAVGNRAVLVFSGMSGVGKTALAVRVAQEFYAPESSEFEVVLMVGLGAAAHARSPEEVLQICLNALGVKQMPQTLEQMQARFRELTSRPTLLLLDDVENAEQVQQLLPGSATAVVVATSRRRTDGFAYYDYEVVPVEVFGPEYALELLTARMSPETIRAQDVSLRELVDRCGRLPYALNIARARLRTHYRGDAAAYVRALNSARSLLAEFTIEGEQRLVHLFNEAYLRLPPGAASLYQLLGVHPGLQFGAHVPEALAGPGRADAVAADLSVLVDWCLLAELPGGRFEIHSLTAEYTRALLADLHAADVHRALVRMVESYLEFAVSRELVLSDRVRFGPLFSGVLEPAYSGDEAYERAEVDLERERANLRRIVAVAAETRLHDLVWQLCEALITFYFQRDLFDDAIEVHSSGLVAAQWLAKAAPNDEPVPLLVMHNALGRAYFGKRRHAEALENFRRAGALAGRLRGANALFGLAQAATWESFVHQRLRDPEAALRALSAAAMFVADPDYPADQRERELRLIDMNGGPMLAAVGRIEEAIVAGRRAVEYFRDGKELHNRAKSVANLGRILAVAGEPYAEEAVELLTLAIDQEIECGLTSWAADSCEVLGELLIRLGRDALGRVWLARAAELDAQLNTDDDPPVEP
ncbi:NB-ARC domain-containing protein [Nocardia macrotermitis]|uniref:NB-ARC domain-containing protein n=1 Tax=Nocardia macrotermitis TaxID=2585198 RepID=A0A7K0D0S9_9NOCA|nr:NB-ARC domain-containing protein [Nocardia macrotermitis]MQY18544.1 hypothetical protein [Nocardia macrotermitis]